MWIVQWLPDSWVLFFTYLILTIGVASYIGSKLLVWVPPIYKYKLVVEILGVLLFSSGAYLYGGRVVEQIWQARVTELEAKLKVIDRAINLEKLKQKVSEDEWGSGFATSDDI